MSIFPTGLYDSAAIINSDLFNDVERTSNSFINFIEDDITDLSNNRIKNIEDNITDLSNTRSKNIQNQNG